jgi:cytochrome c556
MDRPGLTMAFCAMVACGGALAQGDVITERKNIMKGNGAAARTGTQMIRGEAVFDLAKAREVFSGIRNGMTQFPNLFPESSKTGGETRAAPKIWEDSGGFRAAAHKIVQDATAASEATMDLASFQAQFQRVTSNCNACHETYRLNPPR